jgi:hypothetical protein
MNPEQAKSVLTLYRPDSGDAGDPSIRTALAQVERDPELKQWFDRHCAVQLELRQKFRAIPVPANLEEKIVAEAKVVRAGSLWRRPAWLAAAAAVALLLGLSALWLRPRPQARFADCRSRLVRTVLREYRMDLLTNDHGPIRAYLASHGAPSDYALTKGLEGLSVTGAGLLRWHNHPVSMVCFDRGDQQMLFLFVINHAAAADPPPAKPVLTKVNKLLTASWSQGANTYVLAGPEDPGFARKYLDSAVE